MPEWVVPNEAAQARLDVFVAAADPSYSRSQVQRWIEEGHVELNGGRPPKAGVRLQAGDWIRVTPPVPIPSRVQPEAISLDVVYEDDAIIVVNKAKGMVVHPAPGHSSGTLVNALLHHAPCLEGIGGVRRPGIVHRLDKETTGLLVVAKTELAHRRLVAALKARQVGRIYLALAHGVLSEERGTIVAPIGRHPVDRKRMAVVSRGGREAVTRFNVLERLQAYTLLELALETGRTHQIRVHLAHIGHPVVGDTTYGPKQPVLFDDGQALHAARLKLEHPTTGKELEFWAPPPPRFLEVLHELGARTHLVTPV